MTGPTTPPGAGFGAKRWLAFGSRPGQVVATPVAAAPLAPAIAAPAAVASVAEANPFLTQNPAAELAALVPAPTADVLAHGPAAMPVAAPSAIVLNIPPEFYTDMTQTYLIVHDVVQVAKIIHDDGKIKVKPGDALPAGSAFRFNQDATPYESGKLLPGDTVYIDIAGTTPRTLYFTWDPPAEADQASTVPPAPPTVPPAAAAVPLPAPAAPAPFAGPDLATELTDIAAKLMPQAAVAGDSVVPPSDIRRKVEILRQITPHVLASRIADGYQGTIETPNGIGMTLRAVESEPTNGTVLGYALLVSTDKSRAPVEITILAEGESAEAATIVVNHVLASVSRYDGVPSLVANEDWQKAGLLADEGIHASFDALQALANSTRNVSYLVTVKQGDKLHFLSQGDDVGYAFDAKGRFHPARGSVAALTPTSAIDEATWLKDARAGTTDLLGTTPYKDPKTMNEVITPKNGGWVGSANSAVIGRNLGVGNLRDSIGGTDLHAVDNAVFSVAATLAKAMTAEKAPELRPTTSDGRKLGPRTVEPGNIAMWLAVEPSASQSTTERRAAIAQLTKAGLLAKNAATTRDISDARLRMAAALLRGNRYANQEAGLLSLIIGLAAPTP